MIFSNLLTLVLLKGQTEKHIHTIMYAGEGIPSPNLDFRKAMATHSLHTSTKI
jgi:hypothetical protein